MPQHRPSKHSGSHTYSYFMTKMFFSQGSGPSLPSLYRCLNTYNFFICLLLVEEGLLGDRETLEVHH